MKKISYSSILFSAFSQDALLSPVRNTIKPLTPSVKKIIKNQNQNNRKLFMSSSSLNNLNINKFNIIQKKFSNTYFINKNNFSFYDEKFNEPKPKILYGFYSGKSLKKKKIFLNKKKFTKDFIFMKPQRIKSANASFKKIKYNIQKGNMEPYKKYLNEKNKIELNKKAKEREIKYFIEAKKQQELKMENNIRLKYQGLDFSRQKKREFFLAKYLKSKQYKKKEKKVKNNEEEKNIFKQLDYQHLKERLNFEINERKYMFLDNNEFVPRARYANFNERFKSFLRNLKESPNLNELINYISKK